jgi:hypothetical protein
VLVGALALATSGCASSVAPQDTGREQRLLVLEYDDFWFGDWSVELSAGGATYNLRVLRDGRTPRTLRLPLAEVEKFRELLTVHNFAAMPAVLPLPIDDAPRIRITAFASWGDHSVEVQAPFLQECGGEAELVGKLWRALLERVPESLACQGESCEFCI